MYTTMIRSNRNFHHNPPLAFSFDFIVSQNYEKIKDVHHLPAKKQETNSGFLLAGNGPVQLFRFHFKFHCRFFDIFHDCPLFACDSRHFFRSSRCLFCNSSHFLGLP
jgi:hypothetical protein